jgi:diaminopimelate epimerase
MEVVDADGTEAEMCGNGIRAVAIYLLKHWEKHAVYRIETLAGLQKVQLEGDQVRVEMGLPKFKTSAERLEFEVGGRNLILEFRDVNMGNPHAVIFVPTLNQIPLATWGPIIERHPRFPERTNVEFVEVVSQYHLKVLVWERGAGATLACGTGGCAAAVAALLAEKGGRNVEVEFPGGPLRIQWEGRADAPVFMTGPAVEVYSGKLA